MPERKRVTNEQLEHDFLSGDKIDSTTRAETEEAELNNLTGGAGGSTDAYMKLPTRKHKI